MKTLSRLLDMIENRVRNFSKMRNASKDIDQRRKKAPVGWNSVEVIRQTRQAHR